MKYNPAAILLTGIQNETSASQAKHIRNTNIFAIIFGTLVLLYGCLFALMDIKQVPFLSIPFAIIYYSIVYLNKLRHYNISRLLLIINANLTVYTFASIMGLETEIHSWFMVAAIFPVLVYELKDRFNLILTSFLPLVGFLLLQLKIFPPLFLHSAVIEKTDLETIAVSMIIMVFVVMIAVVLKISYMYEQVSHTEKTTEWELKSLQKAINDTVIVSITDKNGKITYANDFLCNLSGYTKEELLNQDHRLLNSGHHPKQFFKDMWETIDQGKLWRSEICNRKKDGTLYWVDSAIMAMRDSSGKIQHYLSIRYDITADKERQMRLIESSKMSSLGEMSAGIAHEINNPLGIISTKVERMLKNLDKQIPDNEAIKRDTMTIDSMVQRISKIVSGLKNYSRNADNDHLEEMNVSTIINSTLELCQERFQRNSIQILSEFHEDFLIEARATQISQVILNLLTNSFDSIENLEDKWIKITTEKNEDLGKIIITDSGPGIPTELLDKIMNPFFTTKDVGKGTGLGLSISQRIIEEHKGKLFYDSTNAHACFVILLPLKMQPRIENDRS